MAQSGRLEATRPDHPASSAERLIRAGQFAEALAEVQALLAAEPDSTKFLRVQHQALMGLRRFAEAAAAIARACDLRPENKHYRKMLAIALKDSGDDAAALPLLEALQDENSRDIDVLSALTVAHYRLGNEADALRCGQRKLDLLVEGAPAQAASAAEGLPAGRNLVSYSLWGSAAQYCEGALINARQVPDVLPGWIARFYVDASVPAEVVAELSRLGGEVIDASDESVPPLMRRFLVHDDLTIGRYIVRDTDSRIGPREMAAIADWLKGGRGFHAMRDHPFHTELIMGGMWGGTAGRGFSMRELIAQAGDDHRYGADQHFLGRHLWPRIRDDLMTHDSHYSMPGSRPFPDGSRGMDADHVGMGILLKDAG